jgi:parallel beta-helix repeat protein
VRLRLILAAAAIAALATVVGLYLADQQSAEAGVITPPPVNCGDTIGPWEFGKLDSDLSCVIYTGPTTDPKPGLRVVGPAVLDLNGHTVSCKTFEEDGPGILVEGKRALVKNGFVTGCEGGVVVGGDGYHTVYKVEVTASDDGFEVESDKNRLIKNTADGNFDDGFTVEGAKNALALNSATGNSAGGFGVEEGATANILIFNSASGNLEDGFGVGEESGGEEAFDNILLFNKANSNTLFGIRVYSGSTGNIIKFNSAFGNASLDTDLVDGHGNCDNNTWRWNRFDTKDPDCIR